MEATAFRNRDKTRALSLVSLVGSFMRSEEGSMAIFTTREAAEASAEGDPFVLNGVVRRWSVREWNEAIASS
jgi:uncharacterized protein YciI